ncbi:16S rRNA (guanine(966)-N(2))-methyltransferase RsmD [Demequina sp. TTPB684]|uniref:16S rRNA (guanine(966)-N(2))-methyltransferase RsmD n=1 Tax=unclassified Demequina TaxID=2620311 RepID=UPI001CF3ECCE|nr:MULTISPECIES: 16S rRNA (guanine(966)-N(2))-methyltransferase RsmD [unclassified Demequina]MCB2411815.1 16S rRNA (guanine(966)-N(2))-methyltransferase RsmD [Demequina sp. TTPB684]UPU88832.1 16S rRNA (guanine(966)-N(2))-methyltransferase RsmD [Demequina sp. TMPB413]
MTRIIAGDVGGRRIAVPKTGTRPTSDRVREAIFSRLDHADALRGAHVVDLFAGSGALGIEALSRGAAHATFVESATPAVRVIESNIKQVGLGTRATIVREKALPYLARASAEWTIAFLDPPYDIAHGDLVPVLEALVPRLASHATVVLEMSTRRTAPAWPHGLDLIQSKAYGETTVYFAEHVR